MMTIDVRALAIVTQKMPVAEFCLRRWSVAEYSSTEFCQGPWNADLGTPPGPEGSNGTLLCIRRGHPGFFFRDEG